MQVCMWACRDDGEPEEPEDMRSELDHSSFHTSMVPESRRYIQRYVGHANVQTDIKEVTFLGRNDELVAAGEASCGLFLLLITLSCIRSQKRPFAVLGCPKTSNIMSKV